MKKCLLFVALFTVLQVNYLRAQNLFEAPDTVCPKQLVQVKSNFPSASSHYWGFCSGYLLNKPDGDEIKDTNFVEGPSAIEIAEDKGRYYGFVIYRATRKFMKLDFGNSLNNQPKIINYGDMDGVLPVSPTTLYVVKTEDSSWHIFVAGGADTSTATLSRIDFDKDLGNTPNIVNFGKLGSVMHTPVGLFIGKEGKNWYGFLLNRRPQADMIRIEFDTNISFTPTLTDLGPVLDNSGAPTLINPNDLAAVYNNGLWHFFVTNQEGNFIFRIDMGNTLSAGSPIAVPIGNLLGKLNAPAGISIIRDCDSMYAFITNRGNHSLVRMEMPTVFGPYTATSYANFGTTGLLQAPGTLSSLIRDRDEIFCFTTNVDTSISRIKFKQCSNANIPFSTTNVPPAYFYDTAGTYNIYYAINEGKPDMQIQCKLITVLPTPPIFITPLDTAICQGDTITLSAFSVNALSYTWSPDHNLSQTNNGKVTAWPEYSLHYKLRMPFPNNCLIDTVIKVKVNKVKADAGPDRTLTDGASTILGGPRSSTSETQQYLYLWSPDQYINDIHALNPVVTPPYDITYTLRVIHEFSTTQYTCESVDTVVVRVECNELNLPNAFVPNGSNTKARFGLANRQIVKLNYFRIYDRWGKLVFTAGDENVADPQKEWDGTLDGNDAPMGVYVWAADGFCASGQRVSKTGNVTLIR